MSATHSDDGGSEFTLCGLHVAVRTDFSTYVERPAQLSIATKPEHVNCKACLKVMRRTRSLTSETTSSSTGDTK